MEFFGIIKFFWNKLFHHVNSPCKKLVGLMFDWLWRNRFEMFFSSSTLTPGTVSTAILDCGRVTCVTS